MEFDLGTDGEAGPTRRTAHELVRETLRRAILRGTLRGGTRLVQADIAQQLGVSTTPVREALRDLATEGLIQLDAHRGAIVHSLELSEVREVYDLRRLLEPEAMRRAAGALDADTIQRAELLQERMDAEAEIGVWADLNRQFHAVLTEAVDSPRLKSILANLRDSAAPYVGLLLQTWDTHTGQANHDHRALLRALAEGDGDGAAEITIRHLDQTVEALEAAHARLQEQAAPEGVAPGANEPSQHD